MIRNKRLTLAATVAVGPESVAGKPVIPPAGLTLAAVWAVVAGLAVDVVAVEEALLEAVLGGLLLRVGGQIARVKELVDELLVLADAVREHAAVVPVVVDAPLDLDDLAGPVGRDGSGAPRGARLVVVDADARVVAAGPVAAHDGGVEVRPRRYWLLDGALGAGIGAGLFARVSGKDIHHVQCLGSGVPQSQGERDSLGWSGIHGR